MGHKGFLKAPSIRAKLLLCFLAIALVVWGLLSSWALSTTRSFVEGKAISAFQSAVDEGIHSADNNAAKVETLEDGTILLVMSEGQDAIFDSIKDALSQ